MKGDSVPLSNSDAHDYEQLIERLERAGGPYSDGLAEPLVGLGRYYVAQGDLPRAQKLYRRALHVVRLNDGLDSRRQLPLLRELFDGYWASGDLERLDQRYDYYFRLFGNGRPPLTAVRLRAALRYLRWQREALRLGVDANPNRRLLKLYQLNAELLDAVAASAVEETSVYAELVASQMSNFYLLQALIEPPLERIGLVTSTSPYGDGWDEMDVNRQRLEVLRRTSFKQGVDLLQAMLATADVSVVPQDDRARWRLALGDWYAWNGAAARAKAEYGGVIASLDHTGRASMLDAWFGQPVELPDNGAFWQRRPPNQARDAVVVHARLNVSAQGRASDVVVEAADPAFAGRAGKLRRKLLHTRFRPRFVGGEEQAVTSLSRDYIFYD